MFLFTCLNIKIIIEIAAVMKMNNLAGCLVYYYDVGNFHSTIFKYTTALHVSATTCIVQPTINRNRIGYTLIRLQRQAALQVQKNATIHVHNYYITEIQTSF